MFSTDKITYVDPHPESDDHVTIEPWVFIPFSASCDKTLSDIKAEKIEIEGSVLAKERRQNKNQMRASG